MNRMLRGKRKKKGVLPRPLGLVFTILIILTVPLPFALYLAGTEWIFSGSQGVPKEFFASYFLGLALLLGSVIFAVIKDRRNKNR